MKKIFYIMALFSLTTFAEEVTNAKTIKAINASLKQLGKVNKPDCTHCAATLSEEIKREAPDTIKSICQNRSVIEAKPLSVADLEKLSREMDSLKKSLVGIFKKTNLSASQLEVLEKRVNSVNVTIRTSKCEHTWEYDILTNAISGCLSNKPVSFEQAYFILAHEFAHSVDPCAFHAGSDFSFFNFEKILKYSRPDDYQKSLQEYPLNSLISCQPARIKNNTLTNAVQDKRWNVFCARPLSKEYFADQVGGYLFRLWAKKQQPEVQSRLKKDVPLLFCPGEGMIGKLVNGTIVYEKGIVEDLSSASPDERYDLYKRNVLDYLSDKKIEDVQKQCTL